MDLPAASGDTARSFHSPKRYFADFDPETLAQVVASAADVALVLDDGVIKDVSLGSDDLMKEGYGAAWRGKPWIDTVTVESKQKIVDLLSDIPVREARWRQVNHPSQSGLDVPIKYLTVPTGKKKRLVAIGRDLRAVAVLQQRLVETHQGLEREYARLREAETRYRVLFDAVSEPVLIVEAASMAIEEVNPAAAVLLATDAASCVGAALPDLFERGSRRDVERLAASALAAGKSSIEAAALSTGARCALSASAFRQSDAARLIVRLHVSPVPAVDDAAARGCDGVDNIIEHLPDGLIVANADLRVLAANSAFVRMAQLIGPQQAIGGPLADWLGRSPTELNMLVTNLKSHGAVRNFATVLRDSVGGEEEVEISAVAAPCETDARYAFSIRSIARRLSPTVGAGKSLPSSVDQVTGLVGRMTLKEIVRESTDLIEKLCIETALDLAGDNRASAAEILGLSRQGLYSKLKRFGIDDAN